MDPKLYHKNIIKRAEDGLGDGTRLATATSATVDQSNYKFTLSGLSLVTDIGADADDKFKAISFISLPPNTNTILSTGTRRTTGPRCSKRPIRTTRGHLR